MKSTQRLHALGQSLWLDNITREMLVDGTLRRYIDDFDVTGLTSNPTIFDHAIRSGRFYDDSIRRRAAAGQSGEDLFIGLALEDLAQAADLFRPAHEASGGVDGWVSMELSPLLADDTAGSIREAKRLHARAERANLFIKIPGTPAGVPAIEEAIFAGVPINVTLLFSREQYLAAANAYLRGVERRIAAGLDPRVNSAASLFVSRWDVAIKDKVPRELRNRLGIAIAKRTYMAYRELLASPRWQGLAGAGARLQRLLWASTGTKDPKDSAIMYVSGLVSPHTVNTMPEGTLKAFGEHGVVGAPLSADGGDAETVLARFARAGVDDAALARQLQVEGAQAFDKAWRDLLDCIAAKVEALDSTAPDRR
jgi:transaldolase